MVEQGTAVEGSTKIIERKDKTIDLNEYGAIKDKVKDFFANHPAETRDLCNSYDEIAEDYEHWMEVLRNSDPIHCAEMYKKHFAAEGHKRIDFGCGSGAVGMALKEMGYNSCDAVDGSEKMLDVCKKQNIYDSYYKCVIGTD